MISKFITSYKASNDGDGQSGSQGGQLVSSLLGSRATKSRLDVSGLVLNVEKVLSAFQWGAGRELSIKAGRNKQTK